MNAAAAKLLVTEACVVVRQIVHAQATRNKLMEDTLLTFQTMCIVLGTTDRVLLGRDLCSSGLPGHLCCVGAARGLKSSVESRFDLLRMYIVEC